MFQRFTQWLLGAPTLAPTPVPPARASLPQPIADFIATTRLNSPEFAAQMGNLAHEGVTPQEFEDFCTMIAKGTTYVWQRFGTVPKAIIFNDEERANLYYNANTQTIRISRNAIKALFQSGPQRESKTEPYVLSVYESAAIRGVEEAYHHYQATKHGDYYFSLKPETNPGYGGYTEGYDNHPFEYDAERIVRQAIIDFGYDKRMYQMYPGLKPLTWQQRIEPARGTPVMPEPVR